MTLSATVLLDRAGIAQRIPHSGTMCLLEGLHAWTSNTIDCSATSHTHADNPLRSASGLLAVNAIEYAAQAMALHGALVAAPGATPSPGYIASVRKLRFAALRLDTAPGPLNIRAERLAGGANEVLYAFSVSDAEGSVLAEGRAAVVLDSAVPSLALESSR